MSLSEKPFDYLVVQFDENAAKHQTVRKQQKIKQIYQNKHTSK